MKKETMSAIKDLILNNDGDFFTSGLKNAENSLAQTKKDFTILTIITAVICIISFAIRVFAF